MYWFILCILFGLGRELVSYLVPHESPRLAALWASPPKLFFCRFYSAHHSHCRLRGRQPALTVVIITLSLAATQLITSSDVPLGDAKLQCTSPWLHRIRPCRSSRTWHQVVSVFEIAPPRATPFGPRAQSQSLTRTTEQIAKSVPLLSSPSEPSCLQSTSPLLSRPSTFSNFGRVSSTPFGCVTGPYRSRLSARTSLISFGCCPRQPSFPG